MSLLDKIQAEMTAAMKARDQARLGALRMIKTALKKYQVDHGGKLDEAAGMKVLQSLVKQRKESIEMYRKAGREEQAAQEEAELKIVESFLPAPATAEEMEAAVEAAIQETGASTMKDMGRVMKAAREKLSGKTVDGKTLSEKVKTRLSK